MKKRRRKRRRKRRKEKEKGRERGRRETDKLINDKMTVLDYTC